MRTSPGDAMSKKSEACCDVNARPAERNSTGLAAVDDWTSLPLMWPHFLDVMGSVWWGAIRRERAESALARSPVGSIVLYGPDEDAPEWTVCSGLAKVEDRGVVRLTVNARGIGRYEVVCEPKIVGMGDYSLLLQAIKVMELRIPRGRFLPCPDASFSGGPIDALVDELNALRRTLRTRELLWGMIPSTEGRVAGAVSKAIDKHLVVQCKRVKGRVNGIVARYDYPQDGYLFNVITRGDCYRRVCFRADKFMLWQWDMKKPQEFGSASDLLEHIDQTLCITLVPVDETVLKEIHGLPRK